MILPGRKSAWLADLANASGSVFSNSVSMLLNNIDNLKSETLFQIRIKPPPFILLSLQGGGGGEIARCFYLSFYIFISFYRYTVRQSVRYNSFSRRFPSLHLGFIFLLSGFLLLESVRRFLWSLSIFLLYIYLFFRKGFWKMCHYLSGIWFWTVLRFEWMREKIFTKMEKKSW